MHETQAASMKQEVAGLVGSQQYSGYWAEHPLPSNRAGCYLHLLRQYGADFLCWRDTCRLLEAGMGSAVQELRAALSNASLKEPHLRSVHHPPREIVQHAQHCLRLRAVPGQKRLQRCRGLPGVKSMQPLG